MHYGLSPSLIRSWANQLLRFYRFIIPPGFPEPGLEPGKKRADVNSISQHANPSRCQWPMLREHGWLANAQSLGDSLRSGPGRKICCGPRRSRVFFFPGDFMAYAVFVEFCSEKRSQPITALFLVQISCSCGDENLDAQNFQTVSALVSIILEIDDSILFKVGSTDSFFQSKERARTTT